jgi:hypothetical protein
VRELLRLLLPAVALASKSMKRIGAYLTGKVPVGIEGIEGI